MAVQVIIAGAARVGAAAERAGAAAGRAGAKVAQKGAQAGARLARSGAKAGAKGTQRAAQTGARGAKAGARGAKKGAQARPGGSGRPGASRGPRGRGGSSPGRSGWDRLSGSTGRGTRHRGLVRGGRGAEAGAEASGPGADAAAAAARQAARQTANVGKLAADTARLAGRTLRGRPKLRRYLKNRLDQLRGKKRNRRLKQVAVLLGLLLLTPTLLGAVGMANENGWGIGFDAAIPDEAWQSLVAIGIPEHAARAYAVAIVRVLDIEPDCGIDLAYLAGFGAMESGHGTVAVNLETGKSDGPSPRGSVTWEPTTGESEPKILGAVLDGSGVGGNTTPYPNNLSAADREFYRQDDRYIRAVGPTQFLPGTWEGVRAVADGNGDGVADPFNYYDGALATAVKTCRDGNGLHNLADQRKAALRYNNLGWYADGVLSHAASYRQLLAALGPMLPPGGTGNVVPTGGTQRYVESKITPTMQRVVDEIVRRFGRGMGIGCFRNGTSGEHPLGRACDFMMAVVDTRPTPQMRAHGKALADWLVSNADSLGVLYVIWEQHIWDIRQPSAGWRLMEDRGGLRQNHFDHVHVSVQR